jgi:hypothetical protein
MWQQWIVGVMVALATVYALWYWMPASLRRRLGRVQKRLGEKPGCGACSSCGGCAAAAKRSVADGAEGQRQPIWVQPRR